MNSVQRTRNHLIAHIGALVNEYLGGGVDVPVGTRTKNKEALIADVALYERMIAEDRAMKALTAGTTRDQQWGWSINPRTAPAFYVKANRHAANANYIWRRHTVEGIPYPDAVTVLCCKCGAVIDVEGGECAHEASGATGRAVCDACVTASHERGQDGCTCCTAEPQAEQVALHEIATITYR